MLCIEGLVKKFNGTGTEKRALAGINLQLQAGDFVTIIGSNGAGKSTLLNAIAGVFPVDGGRIILDGKDITNLPEYVRAHDIGRVFQDPSMGTAPNMTIEENLSLALNKGRRRGLRRGIRNKDRELFRERLKLLGLGLEDRLNEKVGLLSGGQRQALTLLMATIRQPKLLLLDEHIAALDPKTAVSILTLTDKIVRKFNLTTLMVTHNLEHALKYGNRTIMMHEGEIILNLAGPKREVTKVPDLLAYFNQIRGESFVDDRVLLA